MNDIGLREGCQLNPKAKTLTRWSPFIVVVDNDKQLGIFDPRLYRNGKSFLFEYMVRGNTQGNMVK